MKKCASIYPCMRRPLVIHDFATDPFWISLYLRKIWFFLSVHNTLGVRKQHGGVRSGGRSRTNSGEGELPHLHQPGQVPRGPLLLRPGQGQSHLQVSFRTKMLSQNSLLVYFLISPYAYVHYFLISFISWLVSENLCTCQDFFSQEQLQIFVIW